MGGVILTNTEFKDYKIIDKKFIVKTNKCNHFSDNIILTIPKSGLKSIGSLKKISDIKAVNNSKLLRIYAVFDTKKCSWFKNIPKIITDSKISYFILLLHVHQKIIYCFSHIGHDEFLLNLVIK